ncbi:MAG: zf-HC2 domain-containing protein, partial [Thermoanaerobaculia bacterium]
MQHPDEGMIHSWLDGALSAEEATRVESHVGECASCAAAVAEARGFVAASSRILTALDDVPRGVLPAAQAKTRDFRIVWRAAAAVLIVAGGSFVVMREAGPDARVVAEAVTTSAVDQGTVARTAPALPTETAESIRDARPLASGNAATITPAPAAPPVASARRAEPGRQGDLSAGADRGRAKSSVGGVAAGTGVASVATTPSELRMRMNEATPDSDATPLKVVRVERTLGSRRTTYEVAPSESVTLTEPEADSTAARIMLRGNAAAVASGQTESRPSRSAAPMSAGAAKAAP